MTKYKELRFPAPVVEKNLWFTSDLHFYHRSLLKPEYSGRPFADVEEMNEALVANWNAAVSNDDAIFVLGDFAMAGPRSTINVARRLNGKKYLVFGNHDLKVRGVQEFEALFERVIDFGCQIKVDDEDAFQKVRRITLCHYAMRTWNKAHFGTWDLYGHSHANLQEPINVMAMDVGVDAMARRLIEPQSSKWTFRPEGRMMPAECRPEYRPISYAEVKAIMATRAFEPIDHHRKEDVDE